MISRKRVSRLKNQGWKNSFERAIKTKLQKWSNTSEILNFAKTTETLATELLTTVVTVTTALSKKNKQTTIAKSLEFITLLQQNKDEMQTLGLKIVSNDNIVAWKRGIKKYWLR